MTLADALRDVRAAFGKVRVAAYERGEYDGQSYPLPFWLNMLDQQIIEAREHLEAGRPEKAMAEVADCFSVGWQALADNGAPDPEAFIIERIRTRIIPRAEALHRRDAIEGNGYKPGQGREPATPAALARVLDEAQRDPKWGLALPAGCGCAACASGHPCEGGGTLLECPCGSRATKHFPDGAVACSACGRRLVHGGRS